MSQVIIGPVRGSYLNLFEPVARNEGERKKYSGTFLIPKTDKKSIAKLQQAIKEAEQEGKDKKFYGKIPAKCPNPVHDGDGYRESGDEFGPECKGCYVITATTGEKNPPGVIIGPDKRDAKPGEVKSGDYGYVSLNLSAYNYQNTKKGIGAYLNNFWKTKDGEPLGAMKKDAQDDFADLTDVEFDITEPDEDDPFAGLDDEDIVPF